MKKQFKFILIILLTVFISCPAFIGPAFASRERSSPSLGESSLLRAALQFAGKGDTLPDLNINFPTTVTDLIDAVVNSDFVQNIKEFRAQRQENRTNRIQEWQDGWPFGGRTSQE